MSNTKIYTYDVIGYVQKKENKTNSQGDYLQLNFTPLECQARTATLLYTSIPRNFPK